MSRVPACLLWTSRRQDLCQGKAAERSLQVQAQGKHMEALNHARGPGQASFVMAAERGAVVGQLLVRSH